MTALSLDLTAMVAVAGTAACAALALRLIAVHAQRRTRERTERLVRMFAPGSHPKGQASRDEQDNAEETDTPP